MENSFVKESEIKIKIALDENRMPVKISWQSEEGQNPGEWIEGKAFALSIFDKEHKDTFKIDLWTKEMQIAEMDRFIYNALRGLTETYLKATNNAELSNDMQNFTRHFGIKTKILDQ